MTLTGTVDSYIKKWAAENAAQRVRGVQAIANDIEVRLTGDDRRTDADIAAAAAQALEWDSLVPNGAVKVTVSNGWVTLRGTVEWSTSAAPRNRRFAGCPAWWGSVTSSPYGRGQRRAT